MTRPIETDYIKRLDDLLDQTDALLDNTLTKDWHDGLALIRATLAYVRPRLGDVRPVPFQLERADGLWRLVATDDTTFRLYHGIEHALTDILATTWLDVYLAADAREALAFELLRREDPHRETSEDDWMTSVMRDWVASTLRREDAPMRPEGEGHLRLVRAGAFELLHDGRRLDIWFSPEHALEQLARSSTKTTTIHMSERLERELRDAFSYTEPSGRAWLDTNSHRLRLAAIQEHFDNRT